MLSVSKDFVLKIVKTSTFVFCTIVLSLITSSFNFHISNIGAVSETRYFRGDTQTVNSLSAYRLSTTQSTTAQNTAHTSTQGAGNDGLTVYWGIRVWKRDSSGVETEITNEEPVAIVQRTVNGSGTQSATWTPSGTSLVSSDSIIIRVYIQTGTQGWNLGSNPAVFTTEQLGNLYLQNQTWTINYHTERTNVGGNPASRRSTTGKFYWGTTTYNSSVTNFSHNSPTTNTSSEGTQVSNIYANSNDTYIGGAFTFTRGEGTGSITSIKITQTGTVSSSNLSDLRLYYKQESTCSSSIPGDATLFNSTPGTFSSGTSTVTGSMSVGTSQVCLYVELDVSSDANIGDTIEIQITNPSTQVVASLGTVSPSSPVAINGTTTIDAMGIVSISIETDGDIDYGILPATESKSTIDLSDTQTIKNTGNVNINLSVKSTNALGGTSWTLGSNYGNNIFVHEYSSNSGSEWNKFLVADQYYTLTTGLTPLNTQDVDFRITVPSLTTDYLEKNITITILATEST